MPAEYQSVLDFWFSELSSTDWWKKSDTLDQQIADRFGALHKSALAGECSGWRSSAQGRLAEILVLDQFSRNIYRDRAEAFQADGMALVLAQEAVAAGAGKELNTEEKQFIYMPFMHSESLLIHDRAVELFSEPGLENNLDFEHRHRDIIKRFGRYPHRNEVLGRQSTTEEMVFLQEPGSSF